eukprot:GHVU01074255.1.p2 GENE.GHVU01074255.1~~GHVU01074255.1.p2  ORF type:complete len:228 (-),score=29.44 GHVU01074255.1:997-1680(-)
MPGMKGAGERSGTRVGRSPRRHQKPQQRVPCWLAACLLRVCLSACTAVSVVCVDCVDESSNPLRLSAGVCVCVRVCAGVGFLLCSCVWVTVARAGKAGLTRAMLLLKDDEEEEEEMTAGHHSEDTLPPSFDSKGRPLSATTDDAGSRRRRRAPSCLAAAQFVIVERESRKTLKETLNEKHPRGRERGRSIEVAVVAAVVVEHRNGPLVSVCLSVAAAAVDGGQWRGG